MTLLNWISSNPGMTVILLVATYAIVVGTASALRGR